MSEKDVFKTWFREHGIEDVEAFVPDMAGSARGKVMPAGKFGIGDMKMPESVFAQTVSGDYVPDPDIVISGARELEIMEAQMLREGKFTV